MKLHSFGITDVGLKRTHNEDNFYRSDELGLYLVADGMGGHAAGEVASGAAIDAIVRFAERHFKDQSLTWPFGFDQRLSGSANALISGIRLANQTLFTMQQDRPELNGMGTTVATLRIDEGEATIAHVGDSRIYRIRGEEFAQLTSDHSWVNEQLQKNIITAEEARNHRYKNVITRALGNRLELEIDVRTEPIETGDRFVLCSDGLSGMVDDAEMSEVLISAQADLRIAANKLVALANEAGGHDNISVVLIHCEADE
jgi:protein phosphatase